MVTINLNPNKRKQYDLDALLAPDISDTKDKDISDTKDIGMVPNGIPADSIPADSRTKYKTDYKKHHYDRVELYLLKGYKELLKSEATKRGVSLTKLVVNALAEYLQNHPV